MNGAEDIRGIYPILYAFFDREGRLDRALMRRQTKACLAGGAHGLACLGLATEVAKLSVEERLQVMRWMAEDSGGKVPMAATIYAPTVDGQASQIEEAAGLGYAFAILQPPPVTGLAEIEYARFFGAVADRSPIPVAIQNAAQYIGMGLSNATLHALHRNHPNISILKAEGSAVEIARLAEESEGAFRILNGRGGLELTDNLRAGCCGLIPAPECFERQVSIYDAFMRGDEAAAEAEYKAILPTIVFAMQSLQSFLCYGKRILALRLGMSLDEVHDRAPAMTPSKFGLDVCRRLAAELGPLPS